jgi:hypothetical protein
MQASKSLAFILLVRIQVIKNEIGIKLLGIQLII